ncbi:MAG: hypothetical protein CMO61_11590 [Verrucomicrobiales bacterium]|nr:hypothetical protein [Verrucomicrobiales bacterium]|tara:strand:+ start:8621 stop:9244 length:624 start_codon:yes stop_codon:yes gene_type:complete
MKITVLLSLPILLFGFCLTPSEAQSDIQTVYNEGVTLYNDGEYTDAMVKFTAILKEDPRIIHARSYLNKCRLALASKRDVSNDIKAQIAQIIIPQLNFKDAPIGDILDYFTIRAEELSGGKVRPNFIYRGSADQRRNTLVTLSLRNVPMTEAIRYVSQLSETHIKYEEHAIIANPNYGGAAESAPEEALSQGGQTANSGSSGTTLFD